MVNASLNWASIVGIVLAVSGAGLYFLRSFKPALARDYDVFFAAIGLLCGGILFFQGWRLDPILQFGQFLLAGTTVFFAYESVRLRGIATDQARRSSYFDDEFESPIPKRGGYRGSDEDEFDQFEESTPIRRRFSSSDDSNYENPDEDFYRSRRPSRAAIPEQAASRRGRFARDSMNQDSVESRRMARFSNKDENLQKRQDFGDRRVSREGQRRGSRPRANSQTSIGTRTNPNNNNQDIRQASGSVRRPSGRYGEPKGAPIDRKQAEDAAFSRPISQTSRPNGTGRVRDSSMSRPSTGNQDFDPRKKRSSNPKRPRDNSSRFDD